MKYLLDTNTCICYLNGSSEKLRNEFENHFFTDFVICSIVKAELLFGAFKSARVEENLKRIKTFLYPFLSLPFDDKAALKNENTFFRNHSHFCLFQNN